MMTDGGLVNIDRKFKKPKPIKVIIGKNKKTKKHNRMKNKMVKKNRRANR